MDKKIIQEYLERFFKKNNFKYKEHHIFVLPLKEDVDLPKIFKDTDTGFLILFKTSEHKPLRYTHLPQKQIDDHYNNKKIDKSVDAVINYLMKDTLN